MNAEGGKVEDGLVFAFDELIDGKFVSRQVVDLSGNELDYGRRDLDSLFIDRLKQHGYVEKYVGEIELKEEERVPAFAIRNKKAYFGWVFIERFTEKRSRKLFGSVVRNKKGDWLIQVPSNSAERVYANMDFKIEMEAERLFVME